MVSPRPPHRVCCITVCWWLFCVSYCKDWQSSVECRKRLLHLLIVTGYWEYFICLVADMTSKESSTIFSTVLTPCQLLGSWAPLTQNGSETTKSWAVHILTSHQVSGCRCLCASSIVPGQQTCWSFVCWWCHCSSDLLITACLASCEALWCSGFQHQGISSVCLPLKIFLFLSWCMICFSIFSLPLGGHCLKPPLGVTSSVYFEEGTLIS